MKSTEDDAEWVWDRNKFSNRKYLMQEMYQNYVEGDEWDKPKVTKAWGDQVKIMVWMYSILTHIFIYSSILF